MASGPHLRGDVRDGCGRSVRLENAGSHDTARIGLDNDEGSHGLGDTPGAGVLTCEQSDRAVALVEHEDQATRADLRFGLGFSGQRISGSSVRSDPRDSRRGAGWPRLDVAKRFQNSGAARSIRRDARTGAEEPASGVYRAALSVAIALIVAR